MSYTIELDDFEERELYDNNTLVICRIARSFPLWGWCNFTNNVPVAPVFKIRYDFHYSGDPAFFARRLFQERMLATVYSFLSDTLEPEIFNQMSKMKVGWSTVVQDFSQTDFDPVYLVEDVRIRYMFNNSVYEHPVLFIYINNVFKLPEHLQNCIALIAESVMQYFNVETLPILYGEQEQSREIGVCSRTPHGVENSFHNALMVDILSYTYPYVENVVVEDFNDEYWSYMRLLMSL